MLYISRNGELHGAFHWTDLVKWLRGAADQGKSAAQKHLGRFYAEGKGVEQNYSTAIMWLGKAAEQNDIEILNELAWIHATCPNPNFHNGKMAIAYALKAYSQNPNHWSVVDTLAASYARNGQFKEAIKLAEKSIALLNEAENYSEEDKIEKLKGAEERLSLYTINQAYTEK